MALTSKPTVAALVAAMATATGCPDTSAPQDAFVQPDTIHPMPPDGGPLADAFSNDAFALPPMPPPQDAGPDAPPIAPMPPPRDAGADAPPIAPMPPPMPPPPMIPPMPPPTPPPAKG